MRLTLLRFAAVSLSSVGTLVYLAFLYAATWVNCYGTHPLCEAGWLPRTWVTAAYLLPLGGFLCLMRRAIRSAEDDSRNSE